MPKRRIIVGFFLRLFLLYGFLVIPWSVVKACYGSFYRVAATDIFGSLIPGGTVRYERMSEPRGGYDTHIFYMNTRTGAWQTAVASSRDPAYFQTIFLISLVLATPVPWRRRGWALVAGLALVQGFIFLKVFVTLLYGFSRPQVAVLDPAPLLRLWLSAANRILVADLVALLLVPVFIWMLVTFRATDWDGLAGLDTKANTQSHRNPPPS